MKKKIELVIVLLLIAGLLVLNKNLEKQVVSENVMVQNNTVIIDAGHGGADPGKVGVNDVLEKDINLEIAKKVQKRLKKKKVKVIMTRKEDQMLSEDGVQTTKVADLKARVNIINTKKPQLAVSIHQNSYTDPTVQGAQVFYYKNSKDGEEAAKVLQNALLLANPDNHRQAKANDTYYLLKRTEVPTIIIECGFLSNPQEAKKLTEAEYQNKMADAVCEGILEYIQKN